MHQCMCTHMRMCICAHCPPNLLTLSRADVPRSEGSIAEFSGYVYVFAVGGAAPRPQVQRALRGPVSSLTSVTRTSRFHFDDRSGVFIASFPSKACVGAPCRSRKPQIGRNALPSSADFDTLLDCARDSLAGRMHARAQLTGLQPPTSGVRSSARHTSFAGLLLVCRCLAKQTLGVAAKLSIGTGNLRANAQLSQTAKQMLGCWNIPRAAGVESVGFFLSLAKNHRVSELEHMYQQAGGSAPAGGSPQTKNAVGLPH